MDATIEARDADPVASQAAPVHDLHGPLVMGAKRRGCDDGYRQSLRIGDVRPHITAMPQAFHHGVNHDKSGYDVASDRRLLRAAMVGQTTALSTRFNLCENCYMEIENLFRYPALAVGLKPSASQGEAHLRGLERIICSKTI